MDLMLSVLVIFSFLVCGELICRVSKTRNEFTRKFVHITVGTFVAFLPYILTTHEIKLLSGAFLLAVFVSKYFDIFKAIHSVSRITEGEFWFALTVLLLAFSGVHPHIFTVSLLIMGLADGLAAVFGTRWGKNNSYKVFGCTKSAVGTLTFFVVSILLMSGYSYFTFGVTITGWFIAVSFIATVLENFSHRGIDNITVPIAVASMLYLL